MTENNKPIVLDPSDRNAWQVSNDRADLVPTAVLTGRCLWRRNLTLLFGGVNADQGVLHTLADANFLGYDTLMVGDCTATTSPFYCRNATVYDVKRIFGFVVKSPALLAALAP